MMYINEEQIEVSFIVKYDYDSELREIKDIIKQIIDLKKLEKINVEVKK